MWQVQVYSCYYHSWVEKYQIHRHNTRRSYIRTLLCSSKAVPTTLQYKYSKIQLAFRRCKYALSHDHIIRFEIYLPYLLCVMALEFTPRSIICYFWTVINLPFNVCKRNNYPNLLLSVQKKTRHSFSHPPCWITQSSGQTIFYRSHCTTSS